MNEYNANRYAAGPERLLIDQLRQTIEAQEDEGCQVADTDLVTWCVRQELLRRGVKPVTD